MKRMIEIYRANNEASFYNYHFNFRTDNNTVEPYAYSAGNGNKILCYHDAYIVGPIQYSRSYRYIRFKNGKKTKDELKSTHYEMFNQEDLESLLLPEKEYTQTQQISNQNLFVEKIGFVDLNLRDTYFQMYDSGELPEDWVGLLFLCDRKNKKKGYLYKIRKYRI